MSKKSGYLKDFRLGLIFLLFSNVRANYSVGIVFHFNFYKRYKEISSIWDSAKQTNWSKTFFKKLERP